MAKTAKTSKTDQLSRLVAFADAEMPDGSVVANKLTPGASHARPSRAAYNIIIKNDSA